MPPIDETNRSVPTKEILDLRRGILAPEGAGKRTIDRRNRSVLAKRSWVRYLDRTNRSLAVERTSHLDLRTGISAEERREVYQQDQTSGRSQRN